MKEPIAVYVHIPFCPSKCGYCDFNSFAMTGDIINQTVDAIESEIRSSSMAGRPAKTIFFGGGTPTFLEASLLKRLLNAVFEVHPPINDCEITSEANPGTVDIPKFEAMRQMGFNRISLGAQSFNSQDLVRLGRVHESSEIAKAVGAARRAGFANLNLDLMFGLMGQSASAWKRNIDTAISLEPDHLSLYCLTIEPNTRFFRLVNKGMMTLPDDETQVEMYDIAVATCEDAGFELYEISNFAKTGYECRHNLCYWHADEYAGYGPGAVGSYFSEGNRVRYTNTKHPGLYSNRVNAKEKVWCEEEILGPEQLRLEKIMLGLRLREGLERVDLDSKSIQKLVDRNWVSDDGDHVKLTLLGRHFCSEAVLELC